MGAGLKAKSMTTVPAVALAKAGQLTHIVRVMGSCFVNCLVISLLVSQDTCMHSHFPFVTNLGIYFTNASFPVVFVNP